MHSATRELSQYMLLMGNKHSCPQPVAYTGATPGLNSFGVPPNFVKALHMACEQQQERSPEGVVCTVRGGPTSQPCSFRRSTACWQARTTSGEASSNSCRYTPTRRPFSGITISAAAGVSSYSCEGTRSGAGLGVASSMPAPRIGRHGDRRECTIPSFGTAMVEDVCNAASPQTVGQDIPISAQIPLLQLRILEGRYIPALPMTEYTSMASAAQTVCVPKLMMEKAFSGQCCVEVRPTVGRSPTTPHSADGTRTLPPPSMPACAQVLPSRRDVALCQQSQTLASHSLNISTHSPGEVSSRADVA